MNILNKKGTILVATYLVLFVIVVVASSLFSLILNERKNVMRESEGIKALSFAEMGVAYAYYESQNLGWQWYTHKWNDDKDTLSKLEPADMSYHQKLRTDCSFNGDGFYVSNNGEFMVKSYPNADRENETVVVSMGSSGTERRAIKYSLNRQGIYDFFFYSPYTIDLDNAVGRRPKLNGGGIHSNENIRIDREIRLKDCSELSTGENGTIYYAASDRYPAPYYADNLKLNPGTQTAGPFDPPGLDGMAPIVRLDKPWDVFRRDSEDHPGEFGHYHLDKNGDRYWSWNSNATYFSYTNINSWPTKAYRDTEWYFYGDQSPWNNINYNQRDQFGILNDNENPLNKYNLWVKPYLSTDDDGNIISGPWNQIPAELDDTWQWSKYKGSAYGAGSATNEQPVNFYTYDNDGNRVNTKDSWWYLADGKVNMVPTSEVGGADFFTKYPNAKVYWDMFKDPNYWRTIGRALPGGEEWADYFSQDILDGQYGDDRASGGKIPVKHTNTRNQSSSWGSFLRTSGLDGIIMDGNSGGSYLEPPEFGVTYARLAERGGIYIDLVAEFDGTYDDFDEWYDILEKSVDKAVADINGGGEEVAKKVEFINTFTGKWNVVLELDLDKMQKEGKYSDNGILYTKVPIRFTNAQELPRKMEAYGFTVLGEENVYLKGDYNTMSWVTSAVISKKRIFTLSDDFNDPQVIPATEHYRDYPYLYVKKDPVTLVYAESDPTKGGGQWVYRSRLNHYRYDYYTNIDDANEQQLKNVIDAKDGVYRSMFNHHDKDGDNSATFSWAPSNESYEYGMMPNRVYQNQTYNSLIASYRGTKGDVLEKWSYWNPDTRRTVNSHKYLNGAYFILDKYGEFTTPYRQFVDYEKWTEWPSSPKDISLDRRGRRAYGKTCDYARHATRTPSTYMSYDKRFKTATRAPSDVFFGGAQSLWSEAKEDFFYQLTSF